ncbi:MAG TPA: PQQ-binding-like beta-propeller repeat protein [Armatimonadota bacterium]
MKTLTILLLACCASAAIAEVTPFTFAHISDTHITTGTPAHDANLKAAVAELNAMEPRPAFAIHTGDMTEMGSEADFKLYEADIKDAKMPFKNTCGNHETRWADMSVNRFNQHFGSSNISFLHNGVRFIGFNAAIWLEHHGAVSGDTRRWIVSELKKDPKGTPAVLFCHQSPMYPDGLYITGDVELWDAIAPYNVRLFLNGHGHIFKSWTVNGVFCHMTKGMMNENGGYSLYEFTKDDIKVYDKLNGEGKKLIATLPLVTPRVSITIKPDMIVDTDPPFYTYKVTVTSKGPKVARIEELMDHHQRPDDKNWKPIKLGDDGSYTFEEEESRVPGKHTLAVRAVDSDGGVWLRTISMPVVTGYKVGDIDPWLSLKASVFDAGTALQGPCAVDDTSVYAGGWDGVLYNLDKATLKKRWTFATKGAIIGRPDVDGKAVYFGSTDQKIYAVNKKTGKWIWSVATGGPIQGHTLVADGAVFVGSGDHKLYALDAATGNQRWAYEMGMHTQSKPAYADGMIYCGAWDNYFYAIDAKTGDLKWKKKIGTSIFFAPAVNSPIVIDGKIITCASKPASDKVNPNVYCLDAKTGDTLWGFTPEAGACSYASPTSDGERVYLSTLEGELHALNLKDGSVAWRSQMGEGAYDCRPTVHNGQVICNTLYGGVEAVNAATGGKLWSFKTGAGLTFAWPTVDGDTVYEPSMDGTLTAIRIPSAK